MKVAVLGAAGGIGQPLSLLLKTQLPPGSKLSLYDVSSATPGIAMDLSHIPTNVEVKGFSGKDPETALENAEKALKGADVVLISAGKARQPGMDREDLFNVNAKIVQTLVEQIAETCPNALIGIITNPVNSTTVIAAEVLKAAGVYEKKRLFGITTLDTIRANAFIAKLKDRSSQYNVPIIGGHSGKTILPLLSQVKNASFTDQEVKTLTESIQNAGTEVVKAKAGGGSATLSMACAAARFALSAVSALQGKSDVVECAYVESDGQHARYIECDGEPARFFAQPVLLGQNGIEEYENIGKLSDFETQALNSMLPGLREEIKLGENFVKNQKKGSQ